MAEPSCPQIFTKHFYENLTLVKTLPLMKEWVWLQYGIPSAPGRHRVLDALGVECSFSSGVPPHWKLQRRSLGYSDDVSSTEVKNTPISGLQ